MSISIRLPTLGILTGTPTCAFGAVEFSAPNIWRGMVLSGCRWKPIHSPASCSDMPGSFGIADAVKAHAEHRDQRRLGFGDDRLWVPRQLSLQLPAEKPHGETQHKVVDYKQRNREDEAVSQDDQEHHQPEHCCLPHCFRCSP